MTRPPGRAALGPDEAAIDGSGSSLPLEQCDGVLVALLQKPIMDTRRRDNHEGLTRQAIATGIEKSTAGAAARSQSASVRQTCRRERQRRS